ncbi:hypothetical protein [Paenibacillus montanisoli]|uniref:Flagellar protein FliT n=1 Tax=Paenibacillus montanisoli TaxID=2081970 RepID=A0A328U1X5_9BACL|nr:hypothetical protein [Paenibacillus montanisoli]RAP73926.1 hypothetical protein DL346_22880 [Paenibacillus montanisoli]
MEALSELEQLTLQMIADINEVTVEQIESFLDRRGRIIQEIQSYFTTHPKDGSELELVNRILGFDDRILKRMESLKNEAMLGLNNFNRARVQRDAYGASGAYGTDNSLFFDEKN